MIKSFLRSYLLAASALLVFAFAGFNAAIANAATNGAANGFTISPVLTEITVNKGQSQNIPVTISNPTNAPLTAVPVVNDFVANGDESGTPQLLLKDNVPLPSNSFKSLVGNIPTTVIQPNKSETVNVTITVPTNAFSGGYYGAIRFVPTITGQQSNVGLTASVGTLFLVTVPGNLSEKLTLVQFSAADTVGNPSTFFTNGQLTALVRLKNTGNIYTQPYGTFVLKDTWGHIISTTQFNNISPRSSILDGSTRKFITKLPHHNYLGHYTLIASIGYGNNGSSNNLIVSTMTFWYIPVWAQITALVIIVLFVAAIYWLFHTIRSRRFDKK